MSTQAVYVRIDRVRLPPGFSLVPMLSRVAAHAPTFHTRRSSGACLAPPSFSNFQALFTWKG